SQHGASLVWTPGVCSALEELSIPTSVSGLLVAPQNRRSYRHNPIDSSHRLVFLYRSRTAVYRSELARRTSLLRYIPARRISFARVFERADGRCSVSFRLSPYCCGRASIADARSIAAAS